MLLPRDSKMDPIRSVTFGSVSGIHCHLTVFLLVRSRFCGFFGTILNTNQVRNDVFSGTPLQHHFSLCGLQPFWGWHIRYLADIYIMIHNSNKITEVAMK